MAACTAIVAAAAAAAKAAVAAAAAAVAAVVPMQCANWSGRLWLDTPWKMGQSFF